MYIGRMAAGPQHARCCPRVVLMEGLKVRPHPPERGPMQLPLAEGGSIGAHVTRAGGILYAHTQHVPKHGRGNWAYRPWHWGRHLQVDMGGMGCAPAPLACVGMEGLVLWFGPYGGCRLPSCEPLAQAPSEWSLCVKGWVHTVRSPCVECIRF